MKKISVLSLSGVSFLALIILVVPQTKNAQAADTVCTTEYAPVCGVDGTTYSNSCQAGGTPIAYKGVCEGEGFREDLQPFNLLLQWGYLENTQNGSSGPFNGYLNLEGGGKVFARRTVSFESGDSITTRTGSYGKIEWTSNIGSDMDGIQLTVYPKALNEKVDIQMGDFAKTYTVRELRKLNTTIAVGDLGQKVKIKAGTRENLKPVFLYMAWGKLPRFSPTLSDSIKSWQGSLTFVGAKGRLLRTILFDAKDVISPAPGSSCMFTASGSGSILSGSGSVVSGCQATNTITFDTSTSNHFDGILVLVPVETDSLTMVLNDVTKTYTFDELQSIDVAEKLDDQGDGYMLKNLYNNPYTILSNLFDRHSRLLEKLALLQDKLVTLKDLFKLDIASTFQGLNNLKDYLLVKEVYLELENKLADLQAILNDKGLTKDKLVKGLREFGTFVNTLLSKAKAQKFSQNLIPFKDVDDNTWFFDFVKKMKMLKIISGYKDKQGNSLGTFIPQNNVTFAEALKITLNSAGQGDQSDLWTNANVLAEEVVTAWQNHWAKKYLQIALYKNFRLVTDASFNLNGNITRGQVIGLVMESFGVDTSTGAVSCFSDVSTTYKYVKDICKAKDLGLISGNPDGTFKPENPINRAEISKVMSKALEILVN